MNDITALAQRMSVERILEIAKGGTPTIGEKERLAITALYFHQELQVCTQAFQAAGLAQLAAEEALEKAQHNAAVDWEAAASLNVENQELKQRIAELESRTFTVKLAEDKPAESESEVEDAEAWFDEGWNARGEADRDALVAAGIWVIEGEG